MRFRTLVTCGSEVAFAGQQYSGPTYYGDQSESGLWRISIPKFEDYVAAELKLFAFGESIEEFNFGFEIGEFDEWGGWFKATSNYVSYRPKSKLLIAVGQLEWKVVKDLSAKDQLAHLSDALITAIERIGNLKRRPKHFDHLAFVESVREVLSKCQTDTVVADETVD